MEKRKKSEILSIRVEKELYEVLQKMSVKSFTTISGIVHELIVEYYEKNK